MTGFIRTRITWFLYVFFAIFVVVLNTIGPISPFIQSEQGISNLVRGLHLSALALGSIIAGSLIPSVLRRWQNKQALTMSFIGLIVAFGMLIAVRQPVITLGASLAIGIFASFIAVAVMDSLVTEQTEHQAIALVEINMLGTFCAIFVPLIVGGFAKTVVGWRGGIILVMLISSIALGMIQRLHLKTKPDQSDQGVQAGLPAQFWLYWFVLVLGVSIEFCTLFWGASFLETQYSMPTSNATLIMTLFLLSMFVGRFSGSFLVRRIDSAPIVLVSLVLVLLGFGLHWSSASLNLSIVGLIIAGLGTANLYPLVLALALATAPNQTAYATSRVSIASGTAMLVLPFVLGGVADAIGLKWAYAIIGAIAVLALGLMLTTNRHKS